MTFKKLTLTPEQQRKWEDTSAMLGWRAPGLKRLWYRLLDQGGGEYAALASDEVPIAATDGKNIIINPDGFFALDLSNRVLVMGHEIIHNVYGDVELLRRSHRNGYVQMPDGTRIKFKERLLQRAMDARINPILVESKIGTMPKNGVWDEQFNPDEDTVYTLYKRYYEEEEQEGDGGDGGDDGNSGDGGDGGDEFGNDVLPPGASQGKNPDQAERERSPEQWAVEVAQANKLHQAKHGSNGALMQRMVDEILTPEIPWLDHIHAEINRAVNSDGYDWTAPDEWWVGHDLFQPRPSGKGAGWIVLWNDTSGSRGDGAILGNIAEVSGILEDVMPERLTLIWCDAKIDYIDEIESPSDLQHIQKRGVGGGGGTSMMPVLEWIAQQEQQPDLFIGFTDGEVAFPSKEPRFPVIWASNTDNEYPFGKVVRVNDRVV